MTDTVYPKMDPEFKAKWVEALRSGKYKQTSGGLMDNDGCNCCLGVLAEINGVPYRDYDETWDDENHNPDWLNFDDGYKVFQFGGGHDERFGDVPRDYCGLSNDTIAYLINLNDDEKKSFPEIADFIEKNL